MTGPIAWLRQHQGGFHEDFHAFEGSPEDCSDGFCGEINPLVIELQGQDAKLAKLEADNARLLAALERFVSKGVTCHCDRTDHPSGLCAQCAASAAIEEAKR